MKPLSHLQHTLLVAIFRHPHVHGYVLLEYGAQSSVYDALRALAARGLVDTVVAGSSNAPQRKTYQITKSGRSYLGDGSAPTEARLTHYGTPT